MKRYLSTMILCLLGTPLLTQASNLIEGSWRAQDGSKIVEMSVFSDLATTSTRSYYDNGTTVDWFFQFALPHGREVRIGEVIQGHVRSVDGYYNCVFDEPAQALLESPGVLKIHFPLLTYHRETRSVRDSHRGGYYYERRIDWTRWGWVESYYGFPIERYRVISSDCVIDQRNWVTNILTRTQSPF